jgi:hypothetical protein
MTAQAKLERIKDVLSKAFFCITDKHIRYKVSKAINDCDELLSEGLMSTKETVVATKNEKVKIHSYATEHVAQCVLTAMQHLSNAVLDVEKQLDKWAIIWTPFEGEGRDDDFFKLLNCLLTSERLALIQALQRVDPKNKILDIHIPKLRFDINYCVHPIPKECYGRSN